MIESTTQDRIIQAAIELVNEKGYKGATTKMIAERAGVNEVTLFRHFGSKKGIVEAAIHKYSFDDLTDLLSRFDQDVVWDIRKDLNLFVRQYQKLIDKKRDVMLISLKEAGEFPELDKMIAHVPQAYKNKLKSYLSIMMEKGNIRETNVEATATSFMFLNFGYYMLKSRLHSGGEEVSIDSFIENNMEPIIQSLENTSV